MPICGQIKADKKEKKLLVPLRSGFKNCIGLRLFGRKYDNRYPSVKMFDASFIYVKVAPNVGHKYNCVQENLSVCYFLLLSFQGFYYI